MVLRISKATPAETPLASTHTTLFSPPQTQTTITEVPAPQPLSPPRQIPTTPQAPVRPSPAQVQTPVRPSPQPLSPPRQIPTTPQAPVRSSPQVQTPVRLSSVSCEHCRTKKKRCGRQLPSCARCVSNGQECSFRGRVAPPTPTVATPTVTRIPPITVVSAPHPNQCKLCSQIQTERRLKYFIPAEPELSRMRVLIIQKSDNQGILGAIANPDLGTRERICDRCYRQFVYPLREKRKPDGDHEESPKRKTSKTH